VPKDTDAVILELGANDMLRGIDPKIPREALGEIVRRLKARNIEVLLCGMRAAPNLGPDYVRAFDPIYPELAAANDLVFYPFFLDGVVNDPKLHIGDGLHPNGEGVAKIVAGILPKVEAVLTMLPLPFLIKYGSTARAPRNIAFKLVLRTKFHSSSVCSWSFLRIPAPALL